MSFLSTFTSYLYLNSTSLCTVSHELGIFPAWKLLLIFMLYSLLLFSSLYFAFCCIWLCCRSGHWSRISLWDRLAKHLWDFCEATGKIQSSAIDSPVHVLAGGDGRTKCLDSFIWVVMWKAAVDKKTNTIIKFWLEKKKALLSDKLL